MIFVSLFQAYEFFFFAASIEVVCLLFAGMSYFYKYVDPSLLSPSFTATDLRTDQDSPKDGRENRALMKERESPPPPYYGDDTMATSDVDDPRTLEGTPPPAHINYSPFDFYSFNDCTIKTISCAVLIMYRIFMSTGLCMV